MSSVERAVAALPKARQAVLALSTLASAGSALAVGCSEGAAPTAAQKAPPLPSPTPPPAPSDATAAPAPAYKVSVVPLPSAVRPPRDGGGACPVEVRALVQGATRRDAFAVVAVGSDGVTRIVHPGQSFEAGGRRFVVTDMDTEQLILAREGISIRCALARLTR